jgi:hypothetical protein
MRQAVFRVGLNPAVRQQLRHLFFARHDGQSPEHIPQVRKGIDP